MSNALGTLCLILCEQGCFQVTPKAVRFRGWITQITCQIGGSATLEACWLMRAGQFVA